jgi:putative membrane protein
MMETGVNRRRAMRDPALVLACAALWGGWVAPSVAAPPVYAPGAAAQVHPSTPTQRLERRFLQIAAANLRFQADASRMAQSRTNNPAVKDLANTLLARQQTTQPELLRLLHQRDMALPMPTNAHNKVLKQLGKLNGAKFDHLYVEEVVLRSYQADISNFEKVAVQADDPVLKAWIDRQLPTLRFHYAKAGKALPSASLRGQRAV